MSPAMAACPAESRLSVLSMAVRDAARDLASTPDPSCRYGWDDDLADWYSAAYTQAWQGFTASALKRGAVNVWPVTG